MKTTPTTQVMAMILLLPLIGSAADVPRFETFFGFDLARFNPNSPYLPSFNAHGGHGEIVYNLDPRIGIVLDVGAVAKGELNQARVDTTVAHFLAGPRFKYHGSSRFQPFVQMLFGGAGSRASTQLSIPHGASISLPPFIEDPNLATSARLATSRTGFAMLAGGGLDIKINKRLTFRPIGADYYLTRLPDVLTRNPQNVSNFRYSAGISLLLGKE